MEPETKTIAVIGALGVDHIMIVPHFPKTGESIRASHSEKALNGKGANTALSTYRSCHYEESLGRGDGAIRVKMIGKAGDDTYGGYLIAKLLENDIDISGVESAGSALGMPFRFSIPTEQDREDVQRKESWGVQPQCEGVLLPASDLGIVKKQAAPALSLTSHYFKEQRSQNFWREQYQSDKATRMGFKSPWRGWPSQDPAPLVPLIAPWFLVAAWLAHVVAQHMRTPGRPSF
ncbi:ribokinase [Colletotrichum scovillei]|uniref:Ribokinase n=1 Tax=Colletotrichum scovillei TaxID=1209932 RepID=A0A9P7QQX4_9PEZI|nr:ribokinase [Colletotrichum scovillei]KAG7041375.1 ribokinase [Colletotrichum scovillei]KAG7061402.1 ribokinase [Colletotrichum scovillei]